MPPTTKLSAPTRRDRSASEYLEACGLIPKEQPIRSSDWGIVSACPYKYYLTRRLGLAFPFDYSKALSRGSWFHAACESMHLPAHDRKDYIDDKLAAVTAEITATVKATGYPESARQSILERERHDAHTTLAWFNAMLRLKPSGIPDLAAGLVPYMQKFRTVAQELKVSVTDSKFPRTPLVAQYDRLMLDQKGRLWIIDYKTTASDTSARLQQCPFEFQTRHYLYIARKALQDGQLQTLLDLPPATKLAGMLHIAVGKPTIEFGAADRPYVYLSEGKRNKRTGTLAQTEDGSWSLRIRSTETGEETDNDTYATLEDGLKDLHTFTGKKPAKSYTGEPDLAFYTERCYEWMTGTGDYSDHAESRFQAPCINRSFTHTSILDGDTVREYYKQLGRIYHYATVDPYPHNFPRTSDGMTYNRSLHRLAPLYTLPFQQWTSFIKENHIRQEWRD